MAVTKWGRNESFIWPPHSPIYTYGTVFMAVILTGLFVYCRFTFGNGPLQRFYTPIYIRSSVAAVIGASRKDNYRMLMMSGGGNQRREQNCSAGNQRTSRPPNVKSTWMILGKRAFLFPRGFVDGL